MVFFLMQATLRLSVPFCFVVTVSLYQALSTHIHLTRVVFISVEGVRSFWVENLRSKGTQKDWIWQLDALVTPLLPQTRMIISVTKVDHLTLDLITRREPWIEFPGNLLLLHSSCYFLVQDFCFFRTLFSLAIWGENVLKLMAF
jgi:hypothetical protein